MVKQNSRELKLLGCFINGVHFGLKLVAFLVGDWWCWFLLPRKFYPFVDEWYRVFASHAVVGVVCDESCLLPSGMMSCVVAVHDSACLPKLYLIQKLAAGDSNFAYEKLVQVVGG